LTVAGSPPSLPLSRLRCSGTELVRSIVGRKQAWGHVNPAHERIDGDRAVVCYRLEAHSFWLEVQWRRQHDQWVEHDYAVVPGSTVALRLVLADLDPGRVTKALGLQPTRAWQKGEAKPQSRRVREEGLWIHEVFPRGFHWPEEKVAELLGLLKVRPGWREVAGLAGVTWAGVTVQFHGCQEQMGGFALDPAMLEDLMGLTLQLDVDLAAD
jgi:hypothetical protein